MLESELVSYRLIQNLNSAAHKQRLFLTTKILKKLGKISDI